jgi:tetratricopeptide (TPR) repeat protein
MKTFITSALLLFSLVSMATDDKFIEAMKKSIDQLYAANDVAGLQSAVNSFQRIGNAEKTKWEPHYYTTLGYIFMATKEADGGKKDAYLDLAKEALAKAQDLKKDDSELVALDGFISMIKLTVDPATRGQQYSNLAANSFEKAVALNPNNPRALALMAQIQFGTLKFFKQPTTEACERAKKALGLFETEQTSSPIAPAWGKSMTEELLKNCQ